MVKLFTLKWKIRNMDQFWERPMIVRSNPRKVPFTNPSTLVGDYTYSISEAVVSKTVFAESQT